MTPHLQFIPFTSAADKGWAEAMEIYRNSFPEMEQRSEEQLLRALRDSAFTADGIWLDGMLAGICYHWRYDGSHYVEHLAVSPTVRGQQIGSRALAQFCDRRRVVLEIDPPEDEISVRRLRFYERLGFRRNPHEYIHPSFRPPFVHHALVLMSYPALLTDDEARLFADFVRERVLLYSAHEAPVLPRIP